MIFSGMFVGNVDILVFLWGLFSRGIVECLAASWGHSRLSFATRIAARRGIWRNARSRRKLSRSNHYLNFFYLLLFFVKNHWFSWKANLRPLIGEKPISFVPLSNSLVSVSDPWRALTRRPSRALDSPRVLLPKLQRNKDRTLVSCDAIYSEVPGHRQK